VNETGASSLTAAIEAGLRSVAGNSVASSRAGLASLSAGVQRLMAAYRSGEVPAAPVLASRREVAAYAAYRMPATAAATSAAFRQLRLALPAWSPASVLDFGAGTGGASWAVADQVVGPLRLTLLEQSAEAIQLGRSILGGSARAALREAAWRPWRLGAGEARAGPGLRADLAVAAYLLGELTAAQQEALVDLAADAAPVVLLVEPGTPAGHRRILAARDRLLAAGYAVAAPCPHQLGCPLAAAGDWCHFAARVQRSARHRQAKGAELPYEDEKFSYVATARPALRPGWPDARILRRPQLRKNLVVLDLCTASGQSPSRAIGKSKGDLYRRARKASWGEQWDESGKIGNRDGNA
jgi:ribosomal protein RSM22 (predicted rRNA methylase)